MSILVSFDGTDFCGWQVQAGLPTIQRSIEKALEIIEGRPVQAMGSGRTDSGVHALALCAAFDLENPIPDEKLLKALNRYLPRDIRVNEVRERAARFHPRHDAVAKTYEYRIWREEVCPPFIRRYVLHYAKPLNEAAMAAAAARYIGEHNFKAFATVDPLDEGGRSKRRRIYSSEVFRDGGTLTFRVCGSGFLKHMVRHMVGFLLEVGMGKASPDDLAQLLMDGGAKVSQTAAPWGLTQISVEYPLP